jgi:hypothetical protein
MAFSILGSVSCKISCMFRTRQDLIRLDSVSRRTNHHDIGGGLDHRGLGYRNYFCWNCEHFGAVTKQVAVGHCFPASHTAC